MAQDDCAASQFIPFEMESVEQSICDRFEQQAAAFPDRLAVDDGTNRYTYAGLNAAANRIGRTILAQPLDESEPVALLLGQEALTVAAMLGVLKAGRFYLRLDPAWPVERIAQVLDSSGANLVLTVQAHRAQARAIARSGQVIVDCAQLGTETDAANLGRVIAPQAPAFIIYTSGSTGQSKGVLHSHRNLLVEVMNYTNPCRLSRSDAFSLCTSLSFAMSVRHVYASLLNGASLYPFDLAREGFDRLARWLIDCAITVLCMPPTAFRSLCEILPPDAYFPSIRILRIVGESLSGEDLRRRRRHFHPDCMVAHGLGPSETFTVYLSATKLGSCDVDGKLPIGALVPGKEASLLDESGRPVAPGEVGEFVVRSKYLALGYWRRPDLTSAAFSADPRGGEERVYRTGDLGKIRPDGTIVHAGRRDFQVKIRGYRIELAEIELRLRSLDSVKAAIVVAHTRDDGEKALVAYVVPADGSAPSASGLREALARTLPGYMIPSAFMWLERLPTLANGKVDRRALPAPRPQRPPLQEPYVAPGTDTEVRIARIWAEALAIDDVGINDPFMELGGDSLLAARVIARIKDRLGVELELRALFETPTVAALASHIDVQRMARSVLAK
jgi:amino acid adenylation domain-containing protein